MSRLVSAGAAADGPAATERALVREARAFANVAGAVLLRVDEPARLVTVAASDPPPQAANGRRFAPAAPTEPRPLADLPSVADVLGTDRPVHLEAGDARAAAAAIGLPEASGALMLVPARPPVASSAYVLVLAEGSGRGFSRADEEAASAFVAAAAGSLAQAALLAQGARQLARQSALARAAKALNESLDLARVLPRICQEAASILDADVVAVYRGSAGSELVVEATHPGGDAAGTQAESGAALAARVLESGRPSSERHPSASGGVESVLAAPMRWDGQGRGALWVAYAGGRAASDEDLDLLASFAELAAVACRNASVQAGLAEAARTDGLTGCLNHAALHETLRREMQRSRRTGRRLSVVLVDLDHFKHVNETQGHLVGDEVLRRVGRALREAVRPYDFVARYGGDEFAIVCVDATEELAEEIGERSIDRVAGALDEVLGDGTGPHATAGVAEWRPGTAPSDLVRDADRALLYGKQEGVRGRAIRASTVPEGFLLGRTLDDERPPAQAPEGDWPSAIRRETEPLRARARQLALANTFGARIAEMTRVAEIADAAVDELHECFGFLVCALVEQPAAAQPRLRAVRGAEVDITDGAGAWRALRANDVVERCLLERQPVVGGVEGAGVGGEAAVPVWAGSELWGALGVQERPGEAFEQADVRLLETVASLLGAALRSATLFEQLERAYIGTAEALTAALAARDAATTGNARSIVANAERVGRRLGMSDDELRDLRYAAAFRHVGKVAVPDTILNKRGPLTAQERQAVERHPVAGERILEAVEFLERVRPLVRHCNERWDGAGYPDGLAGERIPLGARVIQVCDAHDAMTRDTPYRGALPPDLAFAEIRAGAGAQFDERVASAFLEAVTEPAPA